MGSKEQTTLLVGAIFPHRSGSSQALGEFAHLEGLGYLLSRLSKSLPSVQSYDGIEDEPSKKINSAFCGSDRVGNEGREGRGGGFIRREGDGNGEKEAEIGRVFAVLYPPFITFSRDVTIPFSSITFIFRIWRSFDK